MSIDLDAISPAQRALLVAVGRQYSSEVVLDQADDIVEACRKYVAEIARRGFAARDIERLADGIVAQLEAGTQRGGAKAEVRSATLEYEAALKRAKQARRDADVVLRSARTDLAEAGEAEVVKGIDITLATVSSTGADAKSLRSQLDRLRESLTLEPVVGVSADRGGPEVVIDIDAALTALRAAEKNRPGKPGTPAETERLDLLDGLLIDLMRRARRAGRAAAIALGRPHIADAFELSVLYGGSRQKKSGGEEDPTRTA